MLITDSCLICRTHTHTGGEVTHTDLLGHRSGKRGWEPTCPRRRYSSGQRRGISKPQKHNEVRIRFNLFDPLNHTIKQSLLYFQQTCIYSVVPCGRCLPSYLLIQITKDYIYAKPTNEQSAFERFKKILVTYMLMIKSNNIM